MKIEGLISGKSDHEEVDVGGESLPVTALKKLWDDGYAEIVYYEGEGTFSAWGKTCTGCFTKEQVLSRS